jgi:hypothetical protein
MVNPYHHSLDGMRFNAFVESVAGKLKKSERQVTNDAVLQSVTEQFLNGGIRAHLKIINQVKGCCISSVFAYNYRVIDTGAIYGSKTENS